MKRTALGVFALALVLLVVSAATVGCSKGGTPAGQKKDPITVGSKIDTEGELLSSIIKLTLEDAGFKVVDKSQTGTTDVVRKALLSGEIDVYPEYTGNGLVFFKDSDPPAYKNGQ